MAEIYIALAFGRNNEGTRTYGAIISFNPKENISESMKIYGRLEKGILDVRYRGSSMEEARKSIKDLQEITEDNFPAILTKTLNQEFMEGYRN
ncbi:hypothetical protein HYT25_04090 [Candidatus Pacearchaeota archaeon]|nr:hypothetical protein [Candidatus Pacearchaeota archaeon]